MPYRHAATLTALGKHGEIYTTSLHGPQMISFRFPFLAAALAACFFVNPVFAQYVWLDEKGTKQFSDLPPPPNIPSSRILKQPSGSPSPTSEPTPSSPKAEMTTAEKNAEFRKRRTEQAEKEKKAAEEERAAGEKAKNCERARDFQRTLESGERIARTDKNGERSFLTDEQRSRELQETKRALADCK